MKHVCFRHMCEGFTKPCPGSVYMLYFYTVGYWSGYSLAMSGGAEYWWLL
jgi:hypothetical protein